ncbi:MAG: FCD domain-containing protein [Burkholderiales bacterium]|nr:FCD domain-containing protein [Burkholderiales bacterium]
MNRNLNAPARLADIVAGDLETRILEGSLKPGDRLPAERALAAELGVSRPSLREAIQKLVSKGLLVTRHGGGTLVTDRLESAFVDPWKDMLRAHPALQSDILEFRHMLEGEAALLAAQRATEADLARIDQVYGAMEAAYDSDQLESCIDQDVAFHQAIAEASHNALIGHLSASLMRIVHGHIEGNLVHLHALPAQWGQIRVQHRAIWQALHARDPEAAATAAGVHIEFVRASMVESAKVEARLDTARRRLAVPGRA